MKKYLNIFLILLLSFAITSCGDNSSSDDDENNEEDNVKIVTDWDMNCLRWIDRDVYFATSDPFISERNNEFDKQTVREVLERIEVNTRLGEDYFKFRTKNAELLQPLQSPGLPRDDYDSFILIWEDDRFEDFVNTYLGGFSSIPDSNAVSIVNSTHRRKYYMIIRSSCFDGEGGFECGRIGIDGLNALIARQIGYILQMPPADCETDPENVLCPIASDEQWSETNREKFYQEVTSHLLTIEQNVNFYNDQEYSASCLTKPWMDNNVYVASPNGDKNNTFFVADIFDALEEVSCSSLLGCGYFNKVSPTIPESQIPIYLERAELDNRERSYLMVWPDESFNSFINDNGISPADPNSLLIINQAYKRNFTMIYRASCFDANNPFCDGGNGGITKDGVRALVARQLGLMVGLRIKNCTEEPNHVMCAEIPSDFQWTIDAKNKFFNQFNNALEFIGNNSDFYFEYVIRLDNDLEEEE